MDNGAGSYCRFRDEGDENGLIEIIRDYKDGLFCNMPQKRMAILCNLIWIFLKKVLTKIGGMYNKCKEKRFSDE